MSQTNSGFENNENKKADLEHIEGGKPALRKSSPNSFGKYTSHLDDWIKNLIHIFILIM